MSQCQKGTCFSAALAAEKEVCTAGFPRQAFNPSSPAPLPPPPAQCPSFIECRKLLFHTHPQGSVHFHC